MTIALQLFGWICMGELLVAVVALSWALLLYRRYRRLRRAQNALLQEKEIVFSFVHDVGDVFAEADLIDMPKLLDRVLFYAMRIAKASAGAAYLIEPEGKTLAPRAVNGIFPPLLEVKDLALAAAGSKSQYLHQVVMKQRIPLGHGIVGVVADFGVPTLVGDAERDMRVPYYEEDFLRIRSLLCVPMRFHQKVLGALVLVNRVDGRRFVQADMNLLQALADQASVSVHYAGQQEALEAKRRIDHDLALAHKIQTSLLPMEIPQLERAELAAFNVPALEIGGDYYDFIEVDEDRIGVIVADVSGKGIVGAIMMSICRSVLRASAPSTASPAAVLRAMNRVIREDLTEDMFITAIYAVLNRKSLELTVARAGHDSPIIVSGQNGAIRRVESPGLAVGLGTVEVFDAAIEDRTVTLDPGDLVILYTDGISEAMDAAGEEWGLERFLEAVRAVHHERAPVVIDHVRQQLVRFVGDEPPSDDMTLVALQIKPT